MGDLMQSPRPAESGSFLHQKSVGGQKVQFVQQSVFGEASGVVPAGLSTVFTIDLIITDEAGGVVPYSKIVAWQYASVFVDHNKDLDHEFELHPEISLSHWYDRQVEGVSQRARYCFRNLDTEDHVIYVESEWKYILTA